MLESPGLLHVLEMCWFAQPPLAACLPNGSLGLGHCCGGVLGGDHWDATRQASGAACLARESEPTMARKACWCPLPRTCMGHRVGRGRAPETRAFFHRQCGAVAVVEGLEPDVVKARFNDQVAVLLGGRAIRRRLASSVESVGTVKMIATF